ncbi:TPA: ferredoxin [Candidatus Bathyarchaeota archaeon]|jgi:Fe-S-cluster-containing hydrogenase component 2|nr:ferredoxin [Candidatus Bathyarchaeota archaeon]
MVIVIDYDKCRPCGIYNKPVCIFYCPTGAITQAKDKRPIVNAFLCEDCFECGTRCPYKAIKIKEQTF